MQIAFLAALAGILFGYDTGVISGAILFINQEFALTPNLTGIVVSAVLLGACIGALLSGKLCDLYGRKRLLLWDAQLFIVGTLWSSLAPDIYHLIMARVVVGVAIGIASYSAPTYIAEISLPHERGGRVSYNQLAIALGILMSYLINAVFAPAEAWRAMLGFGIVPALALYFAMKKLPESPRWLAVKGQNEKAKEILTKLYGEQGANEALQDIKNTLHFKQGKMHDLFRSPWRITLIIGCGLALIQQITGINTILYYAPTILSLAGFGSNTAVIFSTIGVGVVFVLVSALAIPLVDNIGRKPLLYIGLILMIVSLLLMSFGLSGNKILLFSSMLLYVIGFGISLGPITWLMIAEIFPLSVRGVGSSLATAVNWISNGLVAFGFIHLVQDMGLQGTILIFAVISVFSLLFIYYVVPETKGCTLEKIEHNLNSGVSAKALGQ